VAQFRPTVLVGSSGQPGAFAEAIVRRMAEHCARPVILPLSNPTDLSEAAPEDILQWTEGRALIATGSPFEPVTYGDASFQISQGNNVFVFPGLGLGALLAGASQVTDGMISAAAGALAGAMTDDELAMGLLFPAISRLRDVSVKVAKAVIDRAAYEGVNTLVTSESGYAGIEDAMWEPRYRDYTAV
jgi:malate dehydrogenase (oxaloacetate-decarboxylating)